MEEYIADMPTYPDTALEPVEARFKALTLGEQGHRDK